MPLHPPIYIAGAGFQAGPVRDRVVDGHAPQTLLEMATHAARHALGKGTGLATAVDAVVFGSAGVVQRNPAGRVHFRHIPNLLAEHLALERIAEDPAGGADRCIPVVGTSDAGAQAVLFAVRALRAGHAETALVAGGEQMFTAGAGPSHRATDRIDNAEFIRSVVGPEESGRFGLTMLSIGDLLMDHIARESGLPAATWRELIEQATLDKHARSRSWSWGMYAGKVEEDPNRELTARTYETSRQVTDWFRLHDIGAPANAASAVVLTTDRELAEAASASEGRPLLHIAGVGHGQDVVELCRRRGPLMRPAAVRRALIGAMKDAQLDPEALCDEATGAGLLHDPFPSIELATLYELGCLRAALGASVNPLEFAMARMRSGWSNPTGGLCANGHALGNAGLFQLAQLGLCTPMEPDDTPLGRDRFLVTSVGSALTNTAALVVARSAAPASDDPGSAAMESTLGMVDAQVLTEPAGSTGIRSGEGLLARTTYIPYAAASEVRLLATSTGRALSRS